MLHSAFRTLSAALILSGAVTPPVHAEVVDKLPSIGTIWTVAVIAAVSCFVLAARRKVLAGLALLPLAWLTMLLEAVLETDLRGAMMAAGEVGYVVHVGLAMGFILLMAALGLRRHPRPSR